MRTIEAPVADWVTIPDLYRDPFPAYERMRAEGGVHWVPAVNRFLITSYAAVHETELDQELFSANEEGSLQIRAMGHSMLRRDDPEHYLERKAWQPVLRPGVVRRHWTDVFRRNARRYLDELIERGSGADLIWDFAAPYAAENLREIIGLHNADQKDLQRWSQTLIDATGNYADDPDVWAKGKASFDEVDDALDEMLRWHAKNPDHSLISQLLRIPDYEMPIERIRANIKMTIGGGLNEPRDALGVAAWAVLRHPEQRPAAGADAALWHSIFDESLRWIAPIGMYSRQVTRDTVLQGVRLRAGAKLGICILSANRDETVWRDAARFDSRREVSPHLAFGKGVHVCLGAWVARAEVADVALPMLFERLEGLRESVREPGEVGGWAFRGMTKLPVEWDRVVRSTGAPAVSSSSRISPSLRVAVVGAGPAGCFTAQAVKRTFPQARIDVFDQLPTPYGLIRYGVAADHGGTKSIARQFDRLFAQPDVRFRGNVHLGRDITLAQLRAAYDVTVLATGMHTDALLPIPGVAEHRDRVHGAGTITRMMNAHPDEELAPILGERVTIVGSGNVAVDLVRLLSCDEQRLDGADIDDEQHQRLSSRVRTIHVVGRSAPASAKFDPVMVRELIGVPGVRHIVHGLDSLPRDGKDARVDALIALAEESDTAARVQVEWHFGAVPVALESQGEAMVLVVEGPEGRTGIEGDDIITAIGFTADEDAPLAPASAPGGRVESGLYTAGWLRRGPQGSIPAQRTDANALARTIADDLRAGRISAGAAGMEPRPDEVDFTGWRRIDARERAHDVPARSRVKLRTRALQLAAAVDLDIDVTDVRRREGGMTSVEEPVTIAYATESGGAELVAEELSRVLTDSGTDVQVADLGELDAADLDASRLHLIICSTYGDGEVPTSIRPLLAQLDERQVDLTTLRYAMFGMGDRSYAKTYSRGSELVDEALALCGATRFGEYGRHDAGGTVLAVDAAFEWLSSVLAAAPGARREMSLDAPRG